MSSPAKQTPYSPFWPAEQPLQFVGSWSTPSVFLLFLSAPDAGFQRWGGWGRSRWHCFCSSPSIPTQPICPGVCSDHIPCWVHHPFLLLHVSISFSVSLIRDDTLAHNANMVQGLCTDVHTQLCHCSASNVCAWLCLPIACHIVFLFQDILFLLFFIFK